MFAMGWSLGGVESIMTYPILMTHKYCAKEDNDRIGVTPNLVRASIGLECVEDIIKDLEQALEKV